MLYKIHDDAWELKLEAIDDRGPVARVYLEKLPGNRVTPHFSVAADQQRTGIASRTLDRLLAMTTDAVVWCDDPTYDGRGCFSPDGQRFADHYRTLRGIPLGTAPSRRAWSHPDRNYVWQESDWCRS